MEKDKLFFSDKRPRVKLQQNNKEQFLRIFLRLKQDKVPDQSDRVFVLNQDIKGVLFCKQHEYDNQKYVTSFMFDDILENKLDDQQCFEIISEKYLQNSFSEKKDLITFAYGNTNSGKTYNIIGNKNYQGLLPKTMDWILNHKEDLSIKFTAFEIYNEKIFDLLSNDTKQFESIDYSNRVVSSQQLLQQLNKSKVENKDDFEKILELTQKNKRMGENLINKNSSRSHCIYKIEVKFKKTFKKISILLVDLAGVERNKSDGNENISSKQFSESKNINLSLSALLRCFRALRQDEFLPYRESVLTKIIFEHLDKNIQINFLITFDPNYKHFENNFRVLDFSHIAKNIKPSVFKNNAQFKDLKEKKILYQNSKSLFGSKFNYIENKNSPDEKLLCLKTSQFKSKIEQFQLKLRRMSFQNKIQSFRMKQKHLNNQSKIDLDFKQDLNDYYINKYCRKHIPKSNFKSLLYKENIESSFFNNEISQKAQIFQEENFQQQNKPSTLELLKDFNLANYEEENKENIRQNKFIQKNQKTFFDMTIDQKIFQDIKEDKNQQKIINLSIRQ